MPGELYARPYGRAGGASGKAGLFPMPQSSGGDALFYIPDLDASTAAPLVVMLHGAGGAAEHSIAMVRAHADRLGLLLLAPQSMAATWDIIAKRRFGADVAAMDDLLRRLFADHAIDPARVAIAGFSDGASYALSLGLGNGELFSHVAAFSPGFMAPARLQGEPRVLISHGDNDKVLPIEPCSRRIVAQLRGLGREPAYREFDGGHVVPDEIARWMFDDVAGV